MKCDICDGKIDEHSHNGKVYWTEGHNAEPLVSGRCCDACNSLVIGFRMFGIYNKEDPNSIHYRLAVEQQRDLLLKVAVIQRLDRGEEEKKTDETQETLDFLDAWIEEQEEEE